MTKLDEAINNCKTDTIDEDLKGVVFKNGDLCYSIHKATIHVKGNKQADGKWHITATLDDDYDYTEIMTLMDEDNHFAWNIGLGTVANDVAAFSQLLGAIHPYKVHVEFYTVR